MLIQTLEIRYIRVKFKINRYTINSYLTVIWVHEMLAWSNAPKLLSSITILLIVDPFRHWSTLCLPFLWLAICQ